jgi:large subunit ribosomal protein L25
MPEIVVSAEKRTEKGKNVNRRLRVAGRIPGIVYGGKGAPEAVAVSPKDIVAVLRSASGENTLFDLDLGGSRRKVILKEYQIEPIKGKLLHADFYEVALDKLLEIKVHVEVTGTPSWSWASTSACRT